MRLVFPHFIMAAIAHVKCDVGSGGENIFDETQKHTVLKHWEDLYKIIFLVGKLLFDETQKHTVLKHWEDLYKIILFSG